MFAFFVRIVLSLDLHLPLLVEGLVLVFALIDCYFDVDPLVLALFRNRLYPHSIFMRWRVSRDHL